MCRRDIRDATRGEEGEGPRGSSVPAPQLAQRMPLGYSGTGI